MAFLAELWLPILLTAVVVFFISFVMWMVSPHHNSDWGPLSTYRQLNCDLLRREPYDRTLQCRSCRTLSVGVG